MYVSKYLTILYVFCRYLNTWVSVCVKSMIYLDQGLDRSFSLN